MARADQQMQISVPVEERGRETAESEGKEGQSRTLPRAREKMAGDLYNLTIPFQAPSPEHGDSCGYQTDPMEDTSTAQYSYEVISSEGPLSCLDSFDVGNEAVFSPKPKFAVPTKPDFAASEANFQPWSHSGALKLVTHRNNRPPKKAYFRIQLIRGLKKSLRQIATRRWPKAGIYQLDKSNPLHRDLWSDYYLRYKELKPHLQEATRVEIYNSVEKSYNNAYCERFFGDPAVRKMYFWYAGLVFWQGMTATEACRKFKFRCCGREEHTEECEAVWAGVKQCGQYGLFKDFGLSPWNGSQWVSCEEVDTELLLSSP